MRGLGFKRISNSLRSESLRSGVRHAERVTGGRCGLCRRAHPLVPSRRPRAGTGARLDVEVAQNNIPASQNWALQPIPGTQPYHTFKSDATANDIKDDR